MRINVILSVLVVLVSYLTCKNLHKIEIPAAQPTPVAEEYKNSGYNWKASHVIEGDNPDNAYIYQNQKVPARVVVPWDKITPPSTSRRAFLSTDWWNLRMAYQPSDTTVQVNYMGKFLKFREDQTFDIIQDGKVQESGHWGYDDPKAELYLACNNTYFNNTWKIHENGFRLVLIGNTDINVTGIQMRLDGYKTNPVKQ